MKNINEQTKKEGAKMTWWQILLALAFVAYLVYGKVQENINPPKVSASTDAIMKDLDLAGNLITETKTASELKEKSDLLFRNLESKYKSDSVAVLAIQTSKDLIKKKKKKRKLHEQNK